MPVFLLQGGESYKGLEGGESYKRLLKVVGLANDC